MCYGKKRLTRDIGSKSYSDYEGRDEDENEVNLIVPHFNIPKPVVIAYNGQKSIVSPLVIRLAGTTPYESVKVVP